MQQWVSGRAACGSRFLKFYFLAIVSLTLVAKSPAADQPPPLTNIVVSVEAPRPETWEPPAGTNEIPGQFTFRRTGPTNTVFALQVAFGGTATLGSDYFANTNMITFMAGQTEVTRLVVPLADNLVEGNEKVVAHLLNAPHYIVDPLRSQATVVIHDKLLPSNVVVRIEPTRSHAWEPTLWTNTVPGEITLHRTGPTNTVLSVLLGYRGIAQLGADFLATNVVTFRPGQTEVTSPIVPLADNLLEGEETVTAYLLRFPHYNIDFENSHATVTIHDSSGPLPIVPVVRVVATQPEATEPNPSADAGQFTFRRTGPTNTFLTANILFGGTATPGADYTANTNQVTFFPGHAEVDRFISPFADDLLEGDETVIVQILPLGSDYAVDPNQNQATVTIHDAHQANASLEITWPHDGFEFFQGAMVPLKAEAVDPHGYIPRVELYAGTNLIGVSELEFEVPPDPGTPLEHEFNWYAAPAGEHTFFAVAFDSLGERLQSGRVRITIHPSTKVVLGVVVPDSNASEPGISSEADPGVFVIRRIGGPTNVAVRAYYAVSGTASNAVDYAHLSGWVDLGTNQASAEIHVIPFRDNVPEGEETVTLFLQPPGCDSNGPDCYAIGDEPRGTVVIHDSTSPGNNPPTSVILKPGNGFVFSLGDPIEVIAAGFDFDGHVEKIELFIDNQLFGRLHTNRLAFLWTNAPLGEHILMAQATDNHGQLGRSTNVNILVRDRNDTAFVFRYLPTAYIPGVPFTVELRVRPPATAQAYAVEDLPPQGWIIRDVSFGGQFDPATGKVKFGPFTDSQPLTLTYVLEPPSNTLGSRPFVGHGSINGTSYLIGGDRSIEQGSTNHPADVNASFEIVLDELTAYAAAWKRGTNSTNHIPLSYVTRAGFLWKNGEAYRFEPLAGPPPLCWVPNNPFTAQTALSSTGGSERFGAQSLQPGISAQMQIAIQPPAGTSAYAVEEQVPEGWSVTAINEGGVFDSGTGTIRWGVFYDGNSRDLQYTITPSANIVEVGHLRGTVSFDGVDRDISGRERIVSTDNSKLPHLQKIEHDANAVRVTIGGEAGQVGVLQRSADLSNWEDVTTLFLPDGTVEYLDQTGTGTYLFYRLHIR